MLTTFVGTLDSLMSMSTFMKMSINRCLDFTKANSGITLVPCMESVELKEALQVTLLVLSYIFTLPESSPNNISPSYPIEQLNFGMAGTHWLHQQSPIWHKDHRWPDPWWSMSVCDHRQTLAYGEYPLSLVQRYQVQVFYYPPCVLFLSMNFHTPYNMLYYTSFVSCSMLWNTAPVVLSTSTCPSDSEPTSSLVTRYFASRLWLTTQLSTPSTSALLPFSPPRRYFSLNPPLSPCFHLVYQGTTHHCRGYWYRYSRRGQGEAFSAFSSRTTFGWWYRIRLILSVKAIGSVGRNVRSAWS